MDEPRFLNLYLARDKDGNWLKADDRLDSMLLGEIDSAYVKMQSGWELSDDEYFGSDFESRRKEIHVLVEVPKRITNAAAAVSTAAVSTAAVSSDMAMPVAAILPEVEKYRSECISLTEWDFGVVHNLPTIANFMQRLGRCTASGKIYWRLEDKQVVSILLDGWFRESTADSINPNADKRSIVMGSPGVGKSTKLCVMAFYLVFKHQKNVLVYRKLDRGNCLFYLGYEGGNIVQFAVEKCKTQDAIAIYEELSRRRDVWLLLDGFQYQELPEGLESFHLLAASQQVNIKSHARDGTYRCLLPCWSKTDLVSMGRLIHGYTAEDMDARFYYSGGRAREFTRATLGEIRDSIDDAIAFVGSSVMTGWSQLNHKYVKDASRPSHFLQCRHWEHVIDSEYAVHSLSVQLGSDAVSRTYCMARSAGHHSFASSVSKICDRTVESHCKEGLFAPATNRHWIGDLPPHECKRQRRE